ncbi:hypothetical protein DRF59_12915 [Chryseobacterium flavum]|uniref:RHS repeat-associated core domain-containing protein n=2 Tax=Chryseobacterium flavum TaxID=415851 RepID=A0A3D9CKV6_9FLAO|nr:hypothetical protein DRF59_12915 [Chryseobacterium flavum]
MYMADLGRWGAIDPLSEMYYPFSPYSFAANNPIKYIDPNGMWIDIKDGDTTYRYNGGKLYTQNSETKKWDVEATVDSNSYVGQIFSALQSMTGSNSDSFGSKFLGLFENDDINATIQDSKRFQLERFRGKNFTLNNDIYTGFNQEVNIYTSMFGESSKRRDSPFHVTLFHELGHTWLNQIGSKEELGKVWVDGDEYNLEGSIKQSEIAASYIENLLRSEQNLPIRTSYSPDAASASTLVNSIVRSPAINKTNGGINSNVERRVFTMPASVQVIYNKMLNNKK